VKDRAADRIFMDGWRPYCWIAVLVFILYGQTVFFGYTGLDDIFLTVKQHKEITRLSDLTTALKADAFGEGTTSFYRPVLTLSFMLDSFWGGVKPSVFHFTNVLLHILACFLFFRFLLDLSGHKKHYSLAGTFLFAAHPVMTQAVAWIPGRNDVLLAVFSLASFIELLKYLKNGKSINYFGHMALLLLALFTKMTALLLPLLFGAYILLLENKDKKSSLVRLLPVWGFCGLSYVLTINALMPPEATLGNGLFNSFGNNLVGLLSYLGKTILPFGLSPLPSPQDIKWLYGLIAMILFGGFAWRFGVLDKRKFFFGWIWFAVLMVPSFIKSTPGAFFLEHRLYLPMVGFIMSLLELNIWRVRSSYHILGTFIVLILVLFGGLTIVHARDFKNEIGFWTYAVKASPSSIVAWWGLGETNIVKGKMDEARRNMQQALDIDPESAVAHNNLGFLFLKDGHQDSAAAELRSAIKLDPGCAEARHNLGTVLMQRGEINNAVKMFKTAISIKPKKANYYTSLGTAQLRNNDQTGAKDNYLKALVLSPTDSGILSGISFLYYKDGLIDSARYYYEQAVIFGLAPDDRVMKTLGIYKR